LTISDNSITTLGLSSSTSDPTTTPNRNIPIHLSQYEIINGTSAEKAALGAEKRSIPQSQCIELAK
jgi:hypothetical protein